jgi:hypothetical protein
LGENKHRYFFREREGERERAREGGRERETEEARGRGRERVSIGKNFSLSHGRLAGLGHLTFLAPVLQLKENDHNTT